MTLTGIFSQVPFELLLTFEPRHQSRQTGFFSDIDMNSLNTQFSSPVLVDSAIWRTPDAIFQTLDIWRRTNGACATSHVSTGQWIEGVCMAAQYSPGIRSVAPKREWAGRHLLLARGELGLEKTLGNTVMTCCLPWVGPKWWNCKNCCFGPYCINQFKISDSRFRPVSSLSSLRSREPALTTGAIGMGSGRCTGSTWPWTTCTALGLTPRTNALWSWSFTRTSTATWTTDVHYIFWVVQLPLVEFTNWWSTTWGSHLGTFVDQAFFSQYWAPYLISWSFDNRFDGPLI